MPAVPAVRPAQPAHRTAGRPAQRLSLESNASSAAEGLRMAGRATCRAGLPVVIGCGHAIAAGQWQPEREQDELLLDVGHKRLREAPAELGA